MPSDAITEVEEEGCGRSLFANEKEALPPTQKMLSAVLLYEKYSREKKRGELISSIYISGERERGVGGGVTDVGGERFWHEVVLGAL